MLRDTQAAIDAVKKVGPVGIVGFCLGGSIALPPRPSCRPVGGGRLLWRRIVKLADEKPKVPTLLHFGEKDAGIPLSDVETIKAKRPDGEIFVYDDAQHGFHCDERASYDKASLPIRLAAHARLLRQEFEEVRRNRHFGARTRSSRSSRFPMARIRHALGRRRNDGVEILEPAFADEHGVARLIECRAAPRARDPAPRCGSA